MTEEEYYQILVDKFLFKVRKGYYYSDEDSWVTIENDVAKVGVSDFLQKTGGDVAFVEFLGVGTSVTQFEEMGELESIKAVIPIVSPVSGVIIEVNQVLKDRPELINEDPYGSGWIAVLKPKNVNEELQHLLDAKGYFELMTKKVAAEQKRLKKQRN